MIDPLNLILALGVAGLVPFLAVVASSFIKISVVFMFVCNVFGAGFLSHLHSLVVTTSQKSSLIKSP